METTFEFNLKNFILNPPDEFALLGLPSGQLVILFGPFQTSSTPELGNNYLYFNDFFLSNSNPFLKSKDKVLLSASQIYSATKDLNIRPPQIKWSENAQSQFLESYSFFRSLLDKQQILKAVPIGFTYGQLQQDQLEGSDFSALLLKTIIGQSGLYSYAIRYQNQILFGATPEILCTINKSAQSIKTEAVAGSIIKTHAPLNEITGKLKEEHELVVKDLELQLSEFGKVIKGEISLKSLSSLSHLCTELQVKYSDEIDLQSLITKLHPSGALGILPRVALTHNYIKNLDLSNRRGSFGSPFGVVFEDGSSTVLVAIRNLIFAGDQVLLGAGAGITKQSETNSELEEVIAKQRSVKSFFGLN